MRNQPYSDLPSTSTGLRNRVDARTRAGELTAYIGLTVIPKVIPHMLFLEHLCFRTSHKGFEMANNPVGEFHADSSSNLTRIFSLHNYIHATGVAILSAKGLGTMTKNNLLGLCVGLTLILHALLRA